MADNIPTGARPWAADYLADAVEAGGNLAFDSPAFAWLTGGEVGFGGGRVATDDASATLGVQRIGEGVGFLGRIFRVTLATPAGGGDDDDGGASPQEATSIVVKYPPAPGTPTHAFTSAMHLHGREVEFYTSFTGEIPAGVLPACLWSVANDDDDDGVIVLEDLSPARCLALSDETASTGVTNHEVDAALAAVARLHGATWGATASQSGAKYVSQSDIGAPEPFLVDYFAASWQTFVSAVAPVVELHLVSGDADGGVFACDGGVDGWKAAVANVSALTGGACAAWYGGGDGGGAAATSSEQPPVASTALCHGDFYLNNVLFVGGKRGCGFACAGMRKGEDEDGDGDEDEDGDGDGDGDGEDGDDGCGTFFHRTPVRDFVF